MIYDQARHNGRAFSAGFAVGSSSAVATLLAQGAIALGAAAAAAALTAYRLRVSRMLRLQAEAAQLRQSLVSTSDRLDTVEEELDLLRKLERSSGPLEASQWSHRIAAFRMKHYGNPVAERLTRENVATVTDRYSQLHEMRDEAHTEGQRANIDAEIKLYEPLLRPKAA